MLGNATAIALGLERANRLKAPKILNFAVDLGAVSADHFYVICVCNLQISLCNSLLLSRAAEGF